MKAKDKKPVLYRGRVEIGTDMDFSVKGPGVTSTFDHTQTFQNDDLDALRQEIVKWLLAIEIRPPHDLDSEYRMFDEKGHVGSFRDIVYEAARAISNGESFFSYGGNRELFVSIE